MVSILMRKKREKLDVEEPSTDSLLFVTEGEDISWESSTAAFALSASDTK
jgi:hypothetical protein